MSIVKIECLNKKLDAYILQLEKQLRRDLKGKGSYLIHIPQSWQPSIPSKILASKLIEVLPTITTADHYYFNTHGDLTYFAVSSSNFDDKESLDSFQGVIMMTNEKRRKKRRKDGLSFKYYILAVMMTILFCILIHHLKREKVVNCRVRNKT